MPRIEENQEKREPSSELREMIENCVNGVSILLNNSNKESNKSLNEIKSFGWNEYTDQLVKKSR